MTEAEFNLLVATGIRFLPIFLLALFALAVYVNLRPIFSTHEEGS